MTLQRVCLDARKKTVSLWKKINKNDNLDFFLSEFAFPFVADTIIAKDAGFVYESLWIESNWVKIEFSWVELSQIELNWVESLWLESNRTLFVKNGFVSPDLQVIWQSRFKLNPRTQICGFIILSIVGFLKMTESLWQLAVFMNTIQIESLGTWDLWYTIRTVWRPDLGSRFEINW